MNNVTANKELVQSFVENILMKGKMEMLPDYIEGDNYKQHNLQIADGLSGLGRTLAEWVAQGITMSYDTVHKIMGDDDLVLVVSEGKLAGKSTSFYDIFRVKEGKIVEHWDNIEKIPEKSEWKNDNGKFNF
jgi:predicted SnoaL-like aldol condensation-catalyzing enzyme